MTNTITEALRHWVPYQFKKENDQLFVRWLYLGTERITEPFFNDTISVRRGLLPNGGSMRVLSHPDLLEEWASHHTPLAPTAFIFHISRCGSTLLSQLLNMQESNIVLSEVPVFDELLRYGFNNDCLPSMLGPLKAAIFFYGNPRFPGDQRLFIKTDSWHIHFYKALRSLYPDTPFLFLYRRPDEVIRSQQKKRGMQSVQGVVEPELFGFDRNEIFQLDFDTYMARVLETYFEAFLDILEKDPLALPVNYNQGGVPIIQQLSRQAGFTITDEELTAMHMRAGFNAKYPDERFTEEAKELIIPPYLKKAFDQYEALEQLRITRY